MIAKVSFILLKLRYNKLITVFLEILGHNKIRGVDMDILGLIDRYFTIISVVWTILSALIGFAATRCVHFIKRQKIRKSLSLMKCDCKIILSQYNKTLHNPNDLIPMCPIGDVQAAINVMDLIYATRLYINQQSIIYEGTYSDSFDNYNIFCIGGFLANNYSFSLFQQFFPKFKMYATAEKAATNPNGLPESCFEISENKNGFCWGGLPGQEYNIESDERYAVIVKLTASDFRSQSHGTVHILFGNGIEGTLAISKYLLNNYNDLYKMVKKHKNHYFIAFKLKIQTMIIDPNSFSDLTEEMFI